MSNQKYKATGIVLKGSSLKENDRLVTILTPEYGLIRAVAPGAKKYKSSLRGRTELFVVNEFMLIKGRSLDKIIQAATLYTYPGLSLDLGKLATAQYLAELSLALGTDQEPNRELYKLLNEHLRRIESISSGESVYPYLAQGIFHLIAISGLTPQIFECCLTQGVINPNLTEVNWRVGFSFSEGGVIDLVALQQAHQHQHGELDPVEANNVRPPHINYRLNGIEVILLQQLVKPNLPDADFFTALGNNSLNQDYLKNSLNLQVAWIRVEKVLREYIQYHIGKTIRSANLVDSLYVEF